MIRPPVFVIFERLRNALWLSEDPPSKRGWRERAMKVEARSPLDENNIRHIWCNRLSLELTHTAYSLAADKREDGIDVQVVDLDAVLLEAQPI
jgi:hypothetical protein